MTVFVEEQKVPQELELDKQDSVALHYIGRIGGQPVATARVVNYHGEAKIGRVAVLATNRGRGLGYKLMESILSELPALGYRSALLDSQTYALGFYEKLGFTAVGSEFLDAGIPHYRMVRSL